MTILNKDQLVEKALLIKYFFSDVDGTLTDGITYYSSNGEELKRFSHIDGTGFLLLHKLSVDAGFITGENSLIVQRRAEKLNLKHCYLGVNDKYVFMSEFANAQSISLQEIAYIGDDLNDLSLMRNVGLSFATSNARSICKSYASIQLNSRGGDGAFREAVEIFMELRGEDVFEVFNRKL